MSNLTVVFFLFLAVFSFVSVMWSQFSYIFGASNFGVHQFFLLSVVAVMLLALFFVYLNLKRGMS